MTSEQIAVLGAKVASLREGYFATWRMANEDKVNGPAWLYAITSKDHELTAAAYRKALKDYKAACSNKKRTR